MTRYWASLTTSAALLLGIRRSLGRRKPEVFKAAYRRRWLVGMGVVAALMLLDVHPCTEGTGGCGQPLVTDGEESCDSWRELYGQDERDFNMRIERVPIESYLAELSDSGHALPAPPTTSRKDMSQAIELDEVQRMRAAVVEYALDAEEPVEVVLDLGAIPFPELGELSTMEPEARARILADRQAIVERAQAGVKELLENLGARTVKPIGLVNHIHAWIPPEAVPEVADHPDVKAVYPAWQSVEALYDLEELRNQTFLAEYWERGTKGESGSRICEPAQGYDDVKIAVIEPWIAFALFPNGLDTSHPGWEDCGSGRCESRIRAIIDCSPREDDAEACRPWTGIPEAASNHGTWVASIAAGDLTQGQDPQTSDVYACRCRTGVAPESSLLYLTAASTGSIGAAISSAFLLGADVINLSVAVAECSGSAFTNCGGINQVIQAVTEGGALVVAAAGNGNPQCAPSSDSNVCYPAFHPSALAVGNVETPPGLTYELADIAESSSRGSLRVGVGGRYSAFFPNGVAIPAVAIAVPGNLSFYFDAHAGYNQVGASGTSFAAPVVSAAAGLIREEFGPEVRDARILRSHVLAMGDGTGGETPRLGVTVGASSTWGAGRAKFHVFDALKSPKGIAHRTFRIHEDELVILTAADTNGQRLDPSVTQWKMGMHIEAEHLSAIPYLVITYWDACNGGNMIAADLQPALDRHAIVEGPAINQVCLEVRVYGLSVPADGARVFVTDYYHAGNPREH